MAKIAIDAGFCYGAQLPNVVHHPIYFADQNWKSPNRTAYMQALKHHKPHMATVLDLEHQEQLNDVLSWAEEASQYVRTVLIIPKFTGAIAQLPRTLNNAQIRLAYSVPTQFGGTDVPAWEFTGWPVHLLGGSPHRQMELANYLDVQSVDGNVHQKLALRYCLYWKPKKRTSPKWWRSLQDSNNGNKWPKDNAHHEAFRRSCNNIYKTWQEI